MDVEEIHGSLDSGEGLKIHVAVIIEDEQGEASVVANDIIDMLTHYIRDYQDGGEEQFREQHAENFITELRRNLGLEP